MAGHARFSSVAAAIGHEGLNSYDQASDLESLVRANLGTKRFAGVWIDPDDGDRLKVGIVGVTTADREAAMRAAEAESVGAAVDVVGVRYSEAQLVAAKDQISEQLASVNKGAPWPIQLSRSVRGNRLKLELPREGELTSAQQTLVDRTSTEYGEMVTTTTYDGRPVGDACVFPVCDPPLRAGIRMDGPAGGFCTGGFLARSRSDNALYMFTAGHCPWAGGTSTWSPILPMVAPTIWVLHTTGSGAGAVTWPSSGS